MPLRNRFKLSSNTFYNCSGKICHRLFSVIKGAGVFLGVAMRNAELLSAAALKIHQT